jgi:hypothetical protein
LVSTLLKLRPVAASATIMTIAISATITRRHRSAPGGYEIAKIGRRRLPNADRPLSDAQMRRS